jgi:hypothetical protein
MGSAIAPVFTYLLAQLPPVVQAVDTTGVVFDGWADAPADTVLVVGATAPGNQVAADETRTYLELGARKVNEEFFVPCFIGVQTGGTDLAIPRATALAIFDGIVSLIASDMTLGGALLNGRWAEISDIGFTQEPLAVTGAMDGRQVVLSFRVHCRNYYSPF